MKYFIATALCLIAISIPDMGNQPVASSEAHKTEILLIGTFHFANFDSRNNRDVTDIKHPDVLEPENQAELAEIAERVSEFNPDKIFIEYRPRRTEDLDSLYRSFSTEDYSKEKRSELEQLAFRIGKKLNHAKIYDFNFTGVSFPYESMLQSMEASGQTELLKRNDSFIKDSEDKYNQLVKSSGSVKEVLFYLNSSAYRKSDLGWYLNISNTAGSVKDTIGTYLASEWYRRNLRMYSNLQKQVTDKENKILVIAGSSHISILKSLIDYHPLWQMVELSEIMK